jgi:pimeloyl-ACP methyl ester carboxylesterase
MLSINDATFLAADGTRIAYRVEGSGPPLVLTNGLTTTTTFWKYVRPIWLQRHTVITWDLPGHGRSAAAQSADSASLLGQPSLLAGVMDAVGLKRAVQIGWSTGCQVVLETYRQLPERCAALVTLLGAAGHVLQTTRLPLPGTVIETLVRRTPAAVFDAQYRALSQAFRVPGGLLLGRVLGLIGRHATDGDMRQVIEHIGTVDPYTLQRLLLSAHQHSAQAVLRALHVPLLIVAGDRDPFAPSARVGMPMHAAAPGSELLRLAQGTHTALLEEPEVIAQAVEDFLARVCS